MRHLLEGEKLIYRIFLLLKYNSSVLESGQLGTVFVSCGLMLKIRTIFLFLLITSAMTLSAHVVSHKPHWITVVSKNSDRPIEGVSITVNDKYIATTGPLGRVMVGALSDEDVVSFYHTSYAPRHYNFKQLARAHFKVGLYESVLNIQEVVIKANRMEADFKQNPQEVRTISAKRMKSQFIGNSADALSLDPNVFIQKSQSGGGSPMIRGMSTSRILILIDGMRLNNAIFRSGNVHYVISLDPLSIADMEISLGPGSVLHGSDALGGTMHINTFDAHYGDSTEVLQSLVYDFSTNNAQLTRRPNFRINYGGLNWAGMTNITYSQYSDVRMGSNRLPWTSQDALRNYPAMCEPITFAALDTMRKPMNSLVQPKTAYDQRNLTQKLKFRITPTGELKFGFYLSMLSDVNRYDRFIETRNGAPRYAYWNYGPQMWSMATAAYEDRKNTAIYDRIKWAAAVQGYQESRDVRRYRNPVARLQTERVRMAQGNVDATKKVSNKLNLSYGADWNLNLISSNAIHYDAQDRDSIWNAQSRYADGSRWSSSAAFISALYTINPNLSFSAGSRLNHIHMFTPIRFNGYENDATWNLLAPSGSIGASYSKKSFKYFLNLSTGFRAPNVDDASKVFDSQPGALIVPNTELKEERLYSAEIGMKHLLGDNVVLDASFYYSYLDDAMIRAPFSFNGQDSIMYDDELSQVLAIQNLDYATIWGYQFGVRSELSKSLFWTVHWSHPFGMDSEGHPLRHASPFNATSQLVYRKKKWTATLTGRYNGEMSHEDLSFSERSKTHIYAIDENGLPYSPRWYTLGLMTNYEFNKNILLRVGIENITDVQYRPYSSGIVAPGRGVFIGLRGSI